MATNSCALICRMNSSGSDITPVCWELEDKNLVGARILAGFIALFIVVGLPWNVSLAATIIWKKLYLQPAIALLLNLAITDILLSIPSFKIVAVGVAGEYIFGNSDGQRCTTCLLTGFFQISLSVNTLFVITLISIDRLVYIQKPFFYERKSTKVRVIFGNTVFPFISLCIGLLSFVDHQVNFSKQLMTCLPNLKSNWYAYVLVVICCVALVIFLVCNIWVIVIVQRNINEIYKTTNMNYSEGDQKLEKRLNNERHRKQVHLFRVFGLLILSNVITWMPKILLFLTVQVKQYSEIDPTFFMLAHAFFVLQIPLHPMLETSLIAEVREPLKHILTCGMLRQKCNSVDLTNGSVCVQCFARDKKAKCCAWFHVLTASILPHAESTSNTTNSRNSTI